MTISSQLRIPAPTLRLTQEIMVKLINQEVVMGRSLEDLVRAALYVACKETNIPLTIDDISEDVSRRRIILSCIKLIDNMGLYHKNTPADNVTIYLNLLAHKCGINRDNRYDVLKSAIDMIDKLKREGFFMNNNHRGYAAAALYLADKFAYPPRTLTQRDIAVHAQITETAIRNAIRNIMKFFGMNELLRRIDDENINFITDEDNIIRRLAVK